MNRVNDPAKNSPTLMEKILHPPTFGTLCGLFSAFVYNMTNAFLRGVPECDPYWVSTIKAVPTTLFMAPWLVLLFLRGKRIFPGLTIWGLLVIGAFVGQVGGNVPFQWALGEIGIALTVPLTLGGMIVFGAILGRIFLREPITQRSLLSMGILLLAVVVLAPGAHLAKHAMKNARKTTADIAVPEAIDSVEQETFSQQFWHFAPGVAAACFSGLAYAALNVFNRYCVGKGAPLPLALLTVSVVGIISLGGISLSRLGLEGISHTTSQQYLIMLAAGVCNAIAFVALTHSLQLTSVVYVNALNATQATMAAITGILFFGEPLSPWLAIGVSLTIVGLVLLGNAKGHSPRPAEIPTVPVE